MKKIVFVLSLLFVFASTAFAEPKELYEIINAAETTEEIIQIIEADSLASLYPDGYAEGSEGDIASFLYNSLPLQNNDVLSQAYTVACITGHRKSWGEILKA